MYGKIPSNRGRTSHERRETIRGEVTLVPRSQSDSKGPSRESSVGSNGSFHSRDEQHKYNEVGGNIVDLTAEFL